MRTHNLTLPLPHLLKGAGHLLGCQMDGQSLSYIDDVLLYTPDETEMQMVNLMDKFLTQVWESGGKMNIAKS